MVEHLTNAAIILAHDLSNTGGSIFGPSKLSHAHDSGRHDFLRLLDIIPGAARTTGFSQGRLAESVASIGIGAVEPGEGSAGGRGGGAGGAPG